MTTQDQRFDPGASHAASVARLDDFVRALEQARIRALLGPDLAALQQLHAPDCQLITPSGRSFTRDRYLEDLAQGRLRCLRWEAGEMQVRSSPAMALVRCQATLELDGGAGSGTPFPCWHTDTDEMRGSGWQAVWSQATAIR